MVIDKLSPADIGNYTITISNVHGEAKQSFNMNLLEKGIFSFIYSDTLLLVRIFIYFFRVVTTLRIRPRA